LVDDHFHCSNIAILGDTSFLDPIQTGKQTNQLNKTVCWRVMVAMMYQLKLHQILLKSAEFDVSDRSQRPRFGDCLPSNAVLGGHFRLDKAGKGWPNIEDPARIWYTTHANNDGLLNVDQIGSTLKTY
jgi:hypothetical protein